MVRHADKVVIQLTLKVLNFGVIKFRKFCEFDQDLQNFPPPKNVDFIVREIKYSRFWFPSTIKL